MPGPQYIDRVEDFCEVVLKSGLLTEPELRSLLDEFETQFAPQSPFGRSLTAWLQFLIGSEAFTYWQVEKLRSGRWKGHFLDGYRLIDHLGSSRHTATYLAEETATGELYELIMKYPLSTQPDYEARRFVKQ